MKTNHKPPPVRNVGKQTGAKEKDYTKRLRRRKLMDQRKPEGKSSWGN